MRRANLTSPRDTQANRKDHLSFRSTSFQVLSQSTINKEIEDLSISKSDYSHI